MRLRPKQQEVYEAEATASTVRDMINKQAEAYRQMKYHNGLDNDQLLLYMNTILLSIPSLKDQH